MARDESARSSLISSAELILAGEQALGRYEGREDGACKEHSSLGTRRNSARARRVLVQPGLGLSARAFFPLLHCALSMPPRACSASSSSRRRPPPPPSSAVTPKVMKRMVKTFVTLPAKDKRALGIIMAEWASARELNAGVRWKSLSDEQIKQITSLQAARAMGVPAGAAKRVVAKVTSLLPQRRIATYRDGKLVSMSGPVKRQKPKWKHPKAFVNRPLPRGADLSACQGFVCLP